MPGTTGQVNVRNMGAMGNGVTDDTNAINQALAVLAQNNGGSLFFPPGIYPISSSLVMTNLNNVMLVGSGIACTQIVRISGFAGATFSSLTGGVRCRDISLPDFTIQGQNTPPSVPATTVAITNPFPFDCSVYIFGGTVTVVTVNGQTSGLTTPATFVVKSGETIAITYSAAPSWNWFGIGG